MTVAVIGGGISGLTTAYRLQRAGVDVRLFEAGPRVGGNIRTEHREGFLIEHGPNSLLTNRALVDLVEDLGITDDILRPRPMARKRYIVRNGKMTALPTGPGGLITGSAFSAAGRLKLLKEPFIRSRSSNGETVASFFERRFGREIVDYAVDPFVSGIYAGDPDSLSIRNAFPSLHGYEAKYGSVIRGALFAPKDKTARVPKSWPRSFAFRNGMSTLISALESELEGVVATDHAVTAIELKDAGYIVGTDRERFDAVVISTPAHAAANIVAAIDANLAQALNAVSYPPIAVVFTAFDASQVAIEPNGFGVLVPSVEKRRILGSLFTSSVFDGRAPQGSHLFTTFIGGSRDPELCSNSDDDLIRVAIDDLRPLLGIEGEPKFHAIKRWKASIPQYNVGYERVPAGIELLRRSHPGIFFCSNFYKGISVGDCVKNATETAGSVRQYLERKQ